MKWISLCLFLISANTYATKQFTEAECILLKHQITDYKRRLGVNSSLYQETNTNVKNRCKAPITIVKKHNQVLTTPVVNTVIPITISKPVLSKNDTKKTSAATSFNPLDIIIKALSYSWPIWIMVLLLGILRLPSVKGRLGELYVSKGLRNKLPSDQYRIINDVTLPLDDGGTTQIDHIIVSSFGIFVIETKNMKGWIFGSEKQARWTQTIYRTKHSFQNPLRQNYKHTQTLSLLLNLSHGLFHSIIIFTSNAELKTNMPANVGHLKGMVAFIMSFKTGLIKPNEQLQIEERINNICLQRGFKTNKDHVSYLKSKHG
ncbi:MAG: nuclease-related domain-containing protein [Colwellia sp.]|nr:nuclease-related domain-containing protein [Colwellia sp.]